jgi:hypothetical protein
MWLLLIQSTQVPPQCAVKVVFDRIIRASWQHFGDIRPAISMNFMSLK